ncbi:DUF84 family protein [Patescibacteria group bacterium]|nr:DUF84 family protein [Patescibacteria group bacterium]
MKGLIVVASLSAHKVGAVHRLCESPGFGSLYVIGCEVRPGVPQPVDSNEEHCHLQQTLECAEHRLDSAMNDHPHADCWIAIENGIRVCSVYNRHYALDYAVVLIQTPDGVRTMGMSEGVELPYNAFLQSKTSDFQQTAGSFVAEKFGGDAADPHQTLTKSERRNVEACSRSDLLYNAVRTTLLRHEAKTTSKWA